MSQEHEHTKKLNPSMRTNWLRRNLAKFGTKEVDNLSHRFSIQLETEQGILSGVAETAMEKTHLSRVHLLMPVLDGSTVILSTPDTQNSKNMRHVVLCSENNTDVRCDVVHWYDSIQALHAGGERKLDDLFWFSVDQTPDLIGIPAGSTLLRLTPNKKTEMLPCDERIKHYYEDVLRIVDQSRAN